MRRLRYILFGRWSSRDAGEEALLKEQAEIREDKVRRDLQRLQRIVKARRA